MASPLFRGEIRHTEATIYQLFRTQYRSFSQKRMLVRFVLGLVLVFVAAFTNLPELLRILLLIAGAWFMVSLDFPGQMNADQALEVRKGILPTMSYVFYSNEMQISGEGSLCMPYKKLIRLVQDAEYLYLFSGPEAVCMIDRSTVKPEDAEKLMAFLAEKTGLEWKTNKSFFFLNLYDLVQILKKGMGKKK